jgi:hypothetical protein
MPILSDDIKLLKSAVMADVPEGGGAMTGIAVVDGETNNVFPDISSDDRAAGRVNFRKLFGVGHSDDNDLLLGASFAVLKPPADPLVHVTCFETDGWADELTAARQAVERYLVKGARLLSRVQDVHYAGALILQLYNIAPATSFPEPGETIVLFNPSGQEQYVRVLKTTLSTALVAISGGAGSLTEVTLCTCELQTAMEFDLLGKQIQFDPPSATNTATVFGTTPSVGTLFHGVKPLGIAAEIGDFTITVAGGIFTPLVPANTVPEPVVDIYPLVERPTLSRTAAATLTLPSASIALAPTTVLQLPTACEPGSLTMTHGATAFTTNSAGQLLQGETVVGTVDYIGRTITMLGTAPSYGTASNTITYKPATVTGATAHSQGVEVTTASQSTAYVFAFEPPPAPATLTVSYMAQGRWYDLTEDGTGKISGASSAYGTGTLNFLTGSMALSLGAPPDVGSIIVMTWGEADSARQATGLPTRAWANIPLDEAPEPGSLAFEWTTGAGLQTATVAGDGTVTGPAQVGEVERLPGGGYQVPFSPNVLPTGPVTVNYVAEPETSAFTNDGGGQYTLTGAPLVPGSVRFQLVASSGTSAKIYQCYSRGTVVYAGSTVIGTINNTTGVMLLSGASSVDIVKNTREKLERSFSGGGIQVGAPWYYYRTTSATTSFAFDLDGILEIGYIPTGGGTADSFAIEPSWFIDTDPPIGLSLVTNGIVFTWADQVHFSRDGSLFRGWAATTGIATAAGSVSSEGRINFTSVPAGGTNAITWSNAAHDARGALDVFVGVFRVPRAPLQAGSFQLQVGSLIGNANSGGLISGDFEGLVDFARGVIYWSVAGLGPGDAEGVAVRADELTYNAVYLQYIPLDESLLGLSTARLPIDGKVPIFRSGGQVIVHNTLTTALPNPLTKGDAYSLGRERIAAVTVRTAAGVRVPGALYEVDFNAGEITVPVESDITGYDQPFTVHHRIEDELLCARADISGALDLVAGLTHDYPADTSYVSSKLRKGDLFSRAFNYLERTTWTGDWSDTLGGSEPTASFNNIDFPILVTNWGAITERWAVIFTGATLVRVVGQNVGQVLTNVSITEAIEAINAQTDVPYFSIPPLGWGGGWAVGNVLRFNTQAAGSPAWTARTTLQGPATGASDSATLAFRSDVDAP